jgi:hypothetical protein
MRRAARENSLALVFLALFLTALVFQAIAGHAAYNAEQASHMEAGVSFWHYVSSSPFAVSVMENWQSEYLQFTLFIVLTVWLFQKGSPESKELDRPGRESDERQRVGSHARADSPAGAKAQGLKRVVYENSLLIVMGAIWVASWLAQSLTGVVEYNAEQVEHHQPAISWLQYLGNASFWERTLENWQSEFLAVGTMAIFAVYLRQRGSPESKPVGAPHDATGVEG